MFRFRSREAMVKEAATIAVQIKFMGDLRAVIGKRNETMTLPQGSTIADLLTSLCASYGEPFTSRVMSKAGTVEHYILMFLNGRNIKEVGGLAAKLDGGDVEIIMLPMFEGG